MEIDITQEIEKTILSMFKGPKGKQAAKLYRKYFSIINFTIIYGIGMLLYNTLFDLNMFVAFIAMIFWTWSMTVGPLGRIWGFKPKIKVESKLESKPKSKKKVKTK